MRRAGLDRLPVLHHRFDAEGLDRAGKSFALRFLPAEDRDRAMIAHEGLVDVEHALRFLARFRFALVHGVAFLPEELGRAQEKPRAHFPADDVGPLVDQDRQIAVTLHPLRVGRADDCLGSWPNDQWLGERTRRDHFSFGINLETAVGDDRAFLGKAFHVRRLLREIAQRNEKREVGVLVAGGLEHRVEMPLHIFPDAVAPRPDDHAAAHLRGLRQFRRADDLLIPLGKIFFAPWRDRCLDGSRIRHEAEELSPVCRNDERELPIFSVNAGCDLRAIRSFHCPERYDRLAL